MSLQRLIKRGIDTPVDYSFIKRVVGNTVKIRMVDHEKDLPHRPTLQQVFKGAQAVAILLHVIMGKTKIGHWICMIQARGKQKISIFDSLGLGVYKLYNYTKEEPKLLFALRGRKWENSTVQLQRFGTHYRECGAFVSVRLKFYRLSNAAFVRLIRSYNKAKPDETVVLLTLLHYLEDSEADITAKNYRRIK